jgi:hypothetical protein
MGSRNAEGSQGSEHGLKGDDMRESGSNNHEQTSREKSERKWSPMMLQVRRNDRDRTNGGAEQQNNVFDEMVVYNGTAGEAREQ